MLRKVFIAAFTAVLIAIFVLCLIPLDGMNIPKVKGLDKVVHMIMYIPFGFLLMGSLRGTVRDDVIDNGEMRFSTNISTSVLITSISGVVCGTLIEGLQTLTGRTCEFVDIISDVLGVFVGCGIFILTTKLIVRYKER